MHKKRTKQSACTWNDYGPGENMMEYGKGDIWREVAPAVEYEADVGKADVYEAEVEDAGVEDSTEAWCRVMDTMEIGCNLDVLARADWCAWNGGCSQKKHWGKEKDKGIIMEICCKGCKAVDVQAN